MPKLNVSDFTKSGVIVLLETLPGALRMGRPARLSRSPDRRATLRTAQRLRRIFHSSPCGPRLVPTGLRPSRCSTLVVTPSIWFHGVCLSFLPVRGSESPFRRPARPVAAVRAAAVRQPSGTTGLSVVPCDTLSFHFKAPQMILWALESGGMFCVPGWPFQRPQRGERGELSHFFRRERAGGERQSPPLQLLPCDASRDGCCCPRLALSLARSAAVRIRLTPPGRPAFPSGFPGNVNVWKGRTRSGRMRRGCAPRRPGTSVSCPQRPSGCPRGSAWKGVARPRERGCGSHRAPLDRRRRAAVSMGFYGLLGSLVALDTAGTPRRGAGAGVRICSCGTWPVAGKWPPTSPSAQRPTKVSQRRKACVFLRSPLSWGTRLLLF